ncbi:hypothetical protein [Pelagimonas sp. KU-00592-HH]|uniref:hypothetical protein n=1 Tax=Pelagimonas sp. KU-00592-HH TaxID=3127651 RepID=UPI00333FB57B
MQRPAACPFGDTTRAETGDRCYRERTGAGRGDILNFGRQAAHGFAAGRGAL